MHIELGNEFLMHRGPPMGNVNDQLTGSLQNELQIDVMLKFWVWKLINDVDEDLF